MQTIRVKRRAEDPPVATLVVSTQASSGSSTGSLSKRRRTDQHSKPPKPAIFRLVETLPSPKDTRPPPELTVTGPTSPDRPERPESPSQRLIRRPVSKRSLLSEVSTPGSTDGASTPPTGECTRKFHLTRRIDGTTGKRSAVLMEGDRKKTRLDSTKGGALHSLKKELEQLSTTPPRAPTPQRERKKPQVHPLEQKQLAEQRSKKDDKEGEDKKETSNAEYDIGIPDELASMVSDYLKENSASVKNLPPTPAPVPKRPIGGGVGGGSWDEPMDPGMSSDEDEFGNKYVYDVYKRETPAPDDMDVDVQAVAAVSGTNWGIITLEDSEEEDFFFHDSDEGSEDDAWDSEDEDSNAEEYYKNEYPEEPSGDEYGFEADDFHDDTDSDLDDEAYGTRRPWESWKSWRKTTNADDEEYDLNDDSDDDLYENERLPAALRNLK